MNSIDQAFHECVNKFEKTFKEFPWESKLAYGAWLKQQTTLVSHTTRYICLAAAQSPLQDREGHYEWIGHLRGEINHDLVAQKDLSLMSSESPEFPVFWSTELILQSQYYWLLKNHPSSLCGYALMLEGLACHHVPPVLPRLEKAHGPKSFQFLKLHANVDQDHYREGMEYLKKIPQSLHPAILKNLEQSTRLYQELLDEAAGFSKLENRKTA